MMPWMTNNGILEIMDQVTNDQNNGMTYATLVYYKGRLNCETNRLLSYEQMTPSEPSQQLDIRRRINDIGHIVDQIETKLTDKSIDHASKSIGMQFSRLTAELKKTGLVK